MLRPADLRHPRFETTGDHQPGGHVIPHAPRIVAPNVHVVPRREIAITVLVGGDPVFFERAEGARLFGVDGRAYIDYVGSWGPMIAGHAHPHIVRAVQRAAERGLSYGAPSPGEVTMAERLCELVEGMDMVRMVNSGTEATMSAIRLARGFTGRDRIVKFEGCYHGHSDALLVKAGSGTLTLGVPTSPGVPA